MKLREASKFEFIFAFDDQSAFPLRQSFFEMTYNISFAMQNWKDQNPK